MLFSTSLITGTFIAISSYSWLGMWMGLEINLLSIIPLMANKPNMMSTEASLKYFLTQALASTMLLFALIMMSMTLMFNVKASIYLTMILNSSLLTKMGAAPFHFWFPEVLEGLSWSNCFIMLSWQKLAPFVLLIYSNKTVMFLSSVIILSMLIGGIMGLNQTSLRKILAYSSINHMGWMIGSMMVMETIWLVYYLIYVIITTNIIFMLKTLNISHIQQMLTSMSKNLMIKLFFITNFLSLGGLPPFLGFMPKWMTIQIMVENYFIALPAIMVILTLITLYFYLRITFSSVLLISINNNYLTDIQPNKFIIIASNMFTLLSLILCTLMFNIS
uniref:NADH-ubiquinone oxidoreductase chain 2 n=1 Tax=Ceruchus chrysomelinus TaxID=617560 RepID=A0A343C4F9_9SCAR|nr:NADH dehydrogenase subunit 2 [Ceruchus chrysomelinus]